MLARLTSGDRPEAVLGDERQELERGTLRVLLAAFPLADKAGCDVEVAGEHRLACAFALTQRADFFGPLGRLPRIDAP
jgi:hypothetical protein